MALWRQYRRQVLSFKYRETTWNSFIVTHNTGLKQIEVLSDALISVRGENMKVKCLHTFSSIMTSCILA